MTAWRSHFCRAFALAAILTTAAPAAESLAWNLRETAMSDDGRLIWSAKSWWKKAQALKEGQRFTLDLNKDGRPDTIITRMDGNIVEAIDDSGHAKDIWNRASTTYIVSYKGTGVVDRMVSYIDNDGDGKSDEVELRYFRDGYLRYAWFGESFDGDASDIFALTNWAYAGNDLGSKFRGNTQIFLNKYDPSTKSWVPLSECPFSFWDLDKDGHGDVVMRVSAAPLASLTGSDNDYANNYNYMWAREATPLEKTGALNMRLSFNVDPKPRKDPLTKPHYNFGFTSVGAQPYQYPGMTDTNPRRRPPQTATRIDWKQRWAPGVNYPASETAFTWDESRSVWRWEGQFWIYERVYLSNTGGPVHRWNMRREYSPAAGSERRIYYSEADRRYHLQGAAEAWLEAGHLVNEQKDLEFRWFDTDGDGRLDTVEVYRPGSSLPVRTNRFDPRAHPAELSIDALTKDYNEKILPESIESDHRFIAALKKIASDPVALRYEAEAAKAEMPERQRYCLDIARELHFLKVRDTILAAQARLPYPGSKGDPEKWRSMTPGSVETGSSMGDSLRFWTLERQLRKLGTQYAEGRFDEAARTLAEFKLD
jgi:hypothetical protein